MRKITQLAAQAMRNGYNFKLDNTEVKDSALYLHGNKIAWYEGGKLFFNCRGWDTVTTLERLRGLGVNIYHKNKELHHNNELIDRWSTYEA